MNNYPTAHVIAYLEAMTCVYQDASEIGVSVSHVAEWYLEAWWRMFADAAMVEVVEVCDCPSSVITVSADCVY